MVHVREQEKAGAGEAQGKHALEREASTRWREKPAGAGERCQHALERQGSTRWREKQALEREARLLSLLAGTQRGPARESRRKWGQERRERDGRSERDQE